MAKEFNIRNGIAGLLFLEGVGQGYNVISATNSSPQTTEVYGDGPRLNSLMKWVWIGHAQVLVFMGLASIIARSFWPLIGGGLVVGTMHCCYSHARTCAKRGSSSSSAAPGAAQETASMSLRGGQTDRQTSGGAPLRTRA